ncbi:phosphodiesterase [Eggerthellaceae bacterium zg-997]|nr:phosphodiesterase [Eggerthellaceae bacterium zg-997]
MSMLIASDVHGSLDAARALSARVAAHGVERVVLLGDLLYHGPRNPLPPSYDPAATARELNRNAAITWAVRGNCDSEVDDWMLEFDCAVDHRRFTVGGVRFEASHGHRPGFTPDDLAGVLPGSVLLYGHTHVKTLERRGGIVLANPGSTTFPKDDGPGYLLFSNGTLTLHSLDGVALRSLRP